MKAFKKLEAAAAAALILSGVSGSALADWNGVIGGANTPAIEDQTTGNNPSPKAEARKPGPGEPGYMQEGYGKRGEQWSPAVKKTLGAGVGAVVGGLIGSQFGGGSGKTVMALLGAGAGGYAGMRIADPKEYIFKDGFGRTWKNGKIPLDPQEEGVYLDKMAMETQALYKKYMMAAEIASEAKHAFALKKIPASDYMTAIYGQADASSRFYQSRNDLNTALYKLATEYDREIPLDNIGIAASCNAIPVGSPEVTTFKQVMEFGKMCDPKFVPNMGMMP